MLAHYLTIKEDGHFETEIKKSRFICYLYRISSEDQAQQYLQKIKKEHWKANHHCVAFLLGEGDEIQRAFDDGEPSGTAGVPILEVLKKKELKNVLAIVVRYFGGTKLGTGGLIRAYSSATVAALAEVGIVSCTLKQVVSFTIDYTAWGKLEHALIHSNFDIKDIQYGEQIHVSCFIVKSQLTTFKAWLTDLLHGEPKIELGEALYHEQLFISNI